MNLEAVKSHEFETITLSYDDRDAMLYALSLGVGQDPMNADELLYVYEKGLQVLPSMSVILGDPGGWLGEKKLDVDVVKLLHGEQRTEFYQPLPRQGELLAEFEVSAVQDKGAEKGALVYFDKVLSDAKSGERYCKVSMVLFLRADGGCGSFGEVPDPLRKVPERAPDFVDEMSTSDQSALIYRLNGDRNPIHADPEIATRAGFPRPILHGLCVYGICGFSVIRQALEFDGSRMRSLDLRFSSPVFPGETLQVEGWRESDGVAFQAKVKERNQIVISSGFVATG